MAHSPKVRCKPYFKLRSQVHRISARPTDASHAQAAPPEPWSVPALCAAYNWPSSQPGGGTIAIVELGGGWVQSDIDAFFQSLNQPVPSLTDVSVDGTENSPNQSVGSSNDADIEVALDIEAAGASYYAATGQPATIRVYWSQDIASAVTKAAEDGCAVCSISWGADEALWGAEAADEMESAATDATDEGMIVFAAAGDNDSSDGGSTPANVDVPSSCPHVIGCGGTFKTTTEETVWNDNPGETTAKAPAAVIPPYFSPCNHGKSARPRRPPELQPAPAAWSPTSPPTPTPTPATRSMSTAPRKLSEAPAPSPLYAGLFAAFGTELGLVSRLPGRISLPSTTSPRAETVYYNAAPGPDPCSGIGSPIGTKIAALFPPSTTGHNPNNQVVNRS